MSFFDMFNQLPWLWKKIVIIYCLAVPLVGLVILGYLVVFKIKIKRIDADVKGVKTTIDFQDDVKEIKEHENHRKNVG